MHINGTSQKIIYNLLTNPKSHFSMNQKNIFRHIKQNNKKQQKWDTTKLLELERKFTKERPTIRKGA